MPTSSGEDIQLRMEEALECPDHIHRSEMLLDLLTDAPQYAEGYLELAKCYIKRRQYNDAITVLKKSIALEDDGWGRIWLGHIYYMYLGDFRTAESEFRRAIKIMSDDATPRWALAELLEDEGKLDECEHLYREALSLDSDFADSHARLGRFLIRSGIRDEAIVSLKWALSIDPKCKVALRVIDEYDLTL